MSWLFYLGIGLAVVGLLFVIRPSRMLGLGTRARSLACLCLGVLLLALAWLWPVHELQSSEGKTRMDLLQPVYHLQQKQSILIDMPSSEVWRTLFSLKLSEAGPLRKMAERQGASAIAESTEDPSLIEALRMAGFVPLDVTQGRHYLLGRVSQEGVEGEWIGLQHMGHFMALEDSGMTKTLLGFLVSAADSEHTELSVDVRVRVLDQAAASALQRRWRVLGPVAAHLQSAFLKAVRKKAEAGA